MDNTPIVLVPGFWLGAWAWDEVAAALRADGHDVTAITLPGLESADADRSSITLSDHIDAICDAVTAKESPVVLAVHSASGFSGYAASDRIPERIAALVYVDSTPGKGALDPEFDGVDKPMVWEEIAEEENLDGLSEEQLETFRQRAVPVPGGVLREERGADERRAPRHPEHDHRHGVHLRAVQGGGEGGLFVHRRPARAAERDLDRPADEPLADVVAPAGDRGDHRRGRDERCSCEQVRVPYEARQRDSRIAVTGTEKGPAEGRGPLRRAPRTHAQPLDLGRALTYSMRSL